MLRLISRCTLARHRCTRGCSRLGFCAWNLVPSAAFVPSELPNASSKRVPDARIGNGSDMGEMPLFGSPRSHVCPKSTLGTLAVVALYPAWLGEKFVALRTS